MVASSKPGKVPAEVLSYLLKRKVRGSFSHEDVWHAEHAQAFAVAKAMESDVVASIKDAVAEALKEGLPFAEFQKRLTPVLADKGWWGRKTQTDPLTGEENEVQLGSSARLKLIYQTNIRTARAAGQWERIQKTKKFLPKLRYRHGHPERPRPEHVAWDGTVLPVDDPWWDTHFGQNGYGCTCYVEQVSGSVPTTADSEVDRELITVRNKRTNKTVKTARGVDPSFAYNPGKVRPFAGDLPPDPTTVVEPPQATPLSRTVSAVSALIGGDMRAARDGIRGLLPPRLSKHGGPNNDEIVLNPALKELGTMHASGRLTISGRTEALLNSLSDKLVTQQKPTDHEIDAVSTLVHEELHHTGPMEPGTYAAPANILIEEVTTETIARKVTRGIDEAFNTPITNLPTLQNATTRVWRVSPGSYSQEIVYVLAALDIASGFKKSETQLHELLESTALAYKKKKKQGQDPTTNLQSETLLEAFVDVLPKGVDRVEFVNALREVAPRP